MIKVLTAAGLAVVVLASLVNAGVPGKYPAALDLVTCRSQVVQVADKPNLTEGEIAYLYLQANRFEVETAELGAQRGTATDVKKHGEMVAKDHRGVIETFEGLVSMSHIKPVESSAAKKAAAKHKTKIAELKKLSGAEFDRAYIAQVGANHRAVIQALKNVLLPATRHAAIKKHFNDMLPAFEHHLAATLEAAKTLNVTIPE